MKSALVVLTLIQASLGAQMVCNNLYEEVTEEHPDFGNCLTADTTVGADGLYLFSPKSDRKDNKNGIYLPPHSIYTFLPSRPKGSKLKVLTVSDLIQLPSTEEAHHALTHYLPAVKPKTITLCSSLDCISIPHKNQLNFSFVKSPTECITSSVLPLGLSPYNQILQYICTTYPTLKSEKGTDFSPNKGTSLLFLSHYSITNLTVLPQPSSPLAEVNHPFPLDDSTKPKVLDLSSYIPSSPHKSIALSHSFIPLSNSKERVYSIRTPNVLSFYTVTEGTLTFTENHAVPAPSAVNGDVDRENRLVLQTFTDKRHEMFSETPSMALFSAMSYDSYGYEKGSNEKTLTGARSFKRFARYINFKVEESSAKKNTDLAYMKEGPNHLYSYRTWLRSLRSEEGVKKFDQDLEESGAVNWDLEGMNEELRKKNQVVREDKMKSWEIKDLDEDILPMDEKTGELWDEWFEWLMQYLGVIVGCVMFIFVAIVSFLYYRGVKRVAEMERKMFVEPLVPEVRRNTV